MVWCSDSQKRPIESAKPVSSHVAGPGLNLRSASSLYQAPLATPGPTQGSRAPI